MSTQMRAQVDKQLSGVSQKLKVEGVVNEMVLPKARSAQYSGKIGKYGAGHLRILNSIVGGKGKYRRAETVTRSSDGFYIESHGLEGLVTDEDYKNVEDPFEAESDETEGITSVLILEKEKNLADVLRSTTTFTQNQTLAGASQFSDYNNSDPVGIFLAALQAIRDGSGGIADTAIMDWDVYKKLRFHPQLIGQLGFKEARPGGLSQVEIAQALDLKRILVPTCKYNAAALGVETPNLQSIWGKDIFVGVLPESAALQQLSVGYQVNLIGEEGWNVTKTPVNNPRGATEIIVDGKYDQVITNAACGYVIKAAIA